MNTTAPRFTKDEAHAELAAQGWTQTPDFHWVKGDQVGRLSWVPNYADPSDPTSTHFFLSHPAKAGGPTKLGMPILPAPTTILGS
jgi:hypothetical protein